MANTSIIMTDYPPMKLEKLGKSLHLLYRKE